MNEDDVFEDKEKYIFLAQLHGMFDEFARETLDNFTILVKDTVCKGCLKGQPVKHFKVSNSIYKYLLRYLSQIADERTMKKGNKLK